MTALPPDYDSDPGRWQSWESPQDVHEIIAPELRGPVLDAGCGEGRLASILAEIARRREVEGGASPLRQAPFGDGARWVGVDSSPTQLAANPYRPVVLADMRALPFRDGTFAEVTHLWCLYHLDDPAPAIAEAARVLAPGGRYYACTAARDSDPEIMYEGYPRSSFDAEEAPGIVASAFDEVDAQRWDGKFFPLQTREEVRAYCRHNFVRAERAEEVAVPLWLTKRGVLVRAGKPRGRP